MNIWRTAWRNVWRSKRRSIVTMAAMTFALFVMIHYSGLLDGYWRAMEHNITALEVGDIQIHAAGYLERPSKYTIIENAQTLLARLDEAGFPASARLLAGALAGSEEASAGVLLRGIDIEREGRASQIHEVVTEGSWLDPEDANGVVLGRRLARTLGVEIGDELVVITQAMDGGMADGLFFVRGILQGIGEGTDRSAVFMNESTFREIMAFPTGAHQIVVRRPSDRPLESVAEQVRSLAGPLDVRTWRQLMPTVAQMLDSTEGLVYIIFGIVYIAVGILILNAMLMAVFERIREFGVLKAIGSGPARVFGLILVESLIQIAIASAVGLALSIPAMLFMIRHGIYVGQLAGISVAGIAMDPVWYGVYTSETFVGPVIMLVAFALLAVLYPALKAAWIRPVEAMRYQ